MESIFVVDGKNLDQLLRRLWEGMVLQGRIVLCLGSNRYLLRIWGYNLVMESARAFMRHEEFNIQIIKLTPRLELKIFKDQNHSLMAHPGLARMDRFV